MCIIRDVAVGAFMHARSSVLKLLKHKHCNTRNRRFHGLHAQSKTRKRAVAYDTSKQSNHISLHHDTVRGPSMPCMTVHVLVARKGKKNTIGRHQSGALLHMQHAKRYNTL
jgi:hypothetical protein